MKKTKKTRNDRLAEPRFAYDGLDRLIHERARLSLLTSLITYPVGLPFNELKRLCALTDGNLNRHLQVLESAHLVTLSKSAEYKRPQTVYRVTALGRKRYIEYLAVLERVVVDAADAVNADSAGKTLQKPRTALTS